MSELGRVDRPLMEERDHPLRPWVLAGVLLLAVLGVAGAFYYAPLAAATPTRCPEGAELVPGPETEDGLVGPELCLVTYAPDADMTFATTVRNTGRLPIRVTGVDFDRAVLDLVEVLAVRTAPPGTGAEPQPLTPFRLGPGEERVVEVQARLRPCDRTREGRLVSLRVLPLRTSIAGIPKTERVPLANEVSALLAGCGR